MVHHLVQGVQQRPQVGIDLGLQVAGQEAEALAGLDRRAHQHDLADRLPLQRGDGHGHGQVGLAGAGRPVAQHDVVLADGLDVARLAGGPRPNLPAGAEDVDRRLARRRLTALHARQHPAHVVGRHVALAVGAGLELFEHFGGLGHGRLGPFDVNLAVVHGDAHAQGVADASQVLVAGAEQRQQRLGTDDR